MKKWAGFVWDGGQVRSVVCWCLEVFDEMLPTQIVQKEGVVPKKLT